MLSLYPAADVNSHEQMCFMLFGCTFFDRKLSKRLFSVQPINQLEATSNSAPVKQLSFLKVQHARFVSNTNVSIYLWEDDLSPKQESVDSACLLKSGSLLKGAFRLKSKEQHVDKTGPTRQFGLHLTELLARLSNNFRNPFLPLGLSSIPFFWAVALR